MIVLEHCDTNNLSFMLHMISNELSNIMCTSTFIHRLDMKFLFYKLKSKGSLLSFSS